MNILMSIKPKYAAQIYDGTKVYEIRKRIPTHLSLWDNIFFYESGTGMVTGSAKVAYIISGTPAFLYSQYHNKLGIGYDDYEKYVGKATDVYYIALVDATKFITPLTLHDLDIRRAPQSFCYLR